LGAYVGHCNFGRIIVHFCYVFIIPPNYLNKLRKCINRIYLGMDTMFSGVH
jgi:hypothetical protein